MRLRQALAVLASAAASALAAGAMLASPASANPRVIHPDGTTFTGLTLSASTIFFGSEQIEVASFTVSNIFRARDRRDGHRLGAYKLVARYGGRSPYAASASAKKTLTVTRQRCAHDLPPDVRRQIVACGSPDRTAGCPV